MTTGFNIATDITRNSEFISMIGFTKQEVKEIIQEVLPKKTEEEQGQIYDEMEQYYDGYRFSEESEERTFNSTLVMYYLKEYLSRGKRPIRMLDMNIAANFQKLANLITLKNNSYSKEVLECLMQKKQISEEIVNKFNLEMEITKKEDAKSKKVKEAKVSEKREEALEQIKAYMEDKRLPKDNMKKFIVIYVGQKLELLEEIE